MRILLDNGLQNGVGTGIDSYTSALKQALSARADVSVGTEDFTPRGGRLLRRLTYLRYLSSRKYQQKLRGFDVVHYTNYAMPKKHPKGTLCAVTVHDLTAFLYPKTLPLAYRFYNHTMVKRAMRRADVIFAVSESAAKEMRAMFPHAAEKITAVYPGHYQGASEGEVAPQYENPALTGLPEKRFFLFVGTLEKRKGLTTFLHAYQRLVRECPTNFSLVLAGRMGYGKKALQKALANLPPEADVRTPGFVSAADRRRLYQDTAAFVFPTVYEGFGSPQTECMANGTPLLLSDIPTNREVSGEYGHYFPAEDEEALLLLLQKVVAGTLPPPDKAVAAKRLSHFTWEQAAEQMVNIYQSKLN